MGETAKKQIEIELRSVFEKDKYDELKSFLEQNATEDLGEDDKDTYFFLMPDKVCKAVNNISKKTAKIVMKLNRISSGANDFEEIEIPIAPADFDKAVKLFSNLGFNEIQQSYQQRHNYMFKGVELALKFTESWGYHLELEIVVDDESKQSEAEKQINQVAEELGVKILTAEELTELAKQIDAKYKKGK